MIQRTVSGLLFFLTCIGCDGLPGVKKNEDNDLLPLFTSGIAFSGNVNYDRLVAIQGNVSGIADGEKAIIADSVSGLQVTLTENGRRVVLPAIVESSAYNITLIQGPDGRQCDIDAGSGTASSESPVAEINCGGITATATATDKVRIRLADNAPAAMSNAGNFCITTDLDSDTCSTSDLTVSSATINGNDVTLTTDVQQASAFRNYRIFISNVDELTTNTLTFQGYLRNLNFESEIGTWTLHFWDVTDAGGLEPSSGPVGWYVYWDRNFDGNNEDSGLAGDNARADTMTESGFTGDASDGSSVFWFTRLSDGGNSDYRSNILARCVAVDPYRALNFSIFAQTNTEDSDLRIQLEAIPFQDANCLTQVPEGDQSGMETGGGGYPYVGWRQNYRAGEDLSTNTWTSLSNTVAATQMSADVGYIRLQIKVRDRTADAVQVIFDNASISQ